MKCLIFQDPGILGTMKHHAINIVGLEPVQGLPGLIYYILLAFILFLLHYVVTFLYTTYSLNDNYQLCKL